MPYLDDDPARHLAPSPILSITYLLFFMKLFFFRSFLCLFLFSTGAAFGQSGKPETRKTHFNLNKKQVAISGYDPVSYFTGTKPKEGSADIQATVQGITYYFATVANKDAFTKDPAKYEPQYGGWCAYAMGNDGSKVEVDPGTFKILNGKLYLFYNQFFTNTLKSWNKDEARLMKNADANWGKTFK